MTVRNFTYKFVEMLNNIDIDNFLSFIQNNINFAEITLLSAFIIGKHPDSHYFNFNCAMHCCTIIFKKSNIRNFFLLNSKSFC
jgi:hypothetical protein